MRGRHALLVGVLLAFAVTFVCGLVSQALDLVLGAGL